MLLHRDASYMETAGEAARSLIETALKKPRGADGAKTCVHKRRIP